MGLRRSKGKEESREDRLPLGDSSSSVSGGEREQSQAHLPGGPHLVQGSVRTLPPPPGSGLPILSPSLHSADARLPRGRCSPRATRSCSVTGTVPLRKHPCFQAGKARPPRRMGGADGRRGCSLGPGTWTLKVNDSEDQHVDGVSSAEGTKSGVARADKHTSQLKHSVDREISGRQEVRVKLF